MIEKEVDPELVEKVRAMSNIDPQQPTAEVYTEESITRRYKLLELQYLDSKKIWAAWLKELKTKKGPLEMSRVNEIQNKCKSMSFEWVLPEKEVFEYVGKQDEAMEPPPELTCDQEMEEEKK